MASTDTNQAKRLYGVMDKRLAEMPYFAGDYSIADMAIFPWPQSHANQGVDLADYSHVKRWYDAILARPAVQRGIKVLTKQTPPNPIDAEARENMFGARRYQRC